MSKVELCEDMTGKMTGMVSISTSVLTNPNCNRNHQVEGSICQKCYSHNMAKMYKSLDAKNQRNTDLLTTRILADDELPVIDDSKYKFGRLEAFGDLHNEIQLENYMNIVKKNPRTKWALYTKCYKISLNYFKTHDVPDNFTLVISSFFINRPSKIFEQFENLRKFKEGQLKLFTVYNSEYIKEHPKEVELNCGARSCVGCNKCYNQCATKYINEILKTDSVKTYKILEKYDSRFIAEANKILDELDEFF